MKHDYLTEEDLDNALKQPWSAEQCILAQAAKRLGLDFCPQDTMRTFSGAVSIGRAFDRAYKYLPEGWEQQIEEIRKQLPFKVWVK